MAVAATPGSIDVRAGDAVRARDALWHVATTRRDREATFLRLHPAVDLRRIDRTLVHPFDRMEPLARRETPTPVSRRRAMRALAELAVASPAFDVPASARTAGARLLAFQLEPLIALRTGVAARVLIADHVGLGKTVQAALIARDLLATDPASSILILTPAGLREQWRAELRERAGLDATLLDADALRVRSATAPPEANPWRSSSIVIASIDFVKQTDVLHGLRSLVWDLLVVDEAHALTPGSDRLVAAQRIAGRSVRIVLLTATPHCGDDSHFRALCELGQLSSADVLAAFRRTRAAAGALPRRVTRRLNVRPSRAELRVHDLLERYARRVWAEAPGAAKGPARLAMTVLFKRAASSSASLVRSLERRRVLLASAPGGLPSQSGLPFAQGAAVGTPEEDDAPDSVLAAPGLSDHRERTWLNLLIHAGREAAGDERKLRALTRLVRRVREPLIVFTEYRDTLHRIEVLLARVATVTALHGGKTSEARADALRAFDSGAARVLVATDAASEGLNLHRRCRLVVHVELPWSPLRLEQRVGRVDRLGQTRTVHTVPLVARNTVESRIEVRLAERMRRIREALGEAGGDSANVDPVSALGAALRTQPPDGSPFTDDPLHGDPTRATPPTYAEWPQLGRAAEASVAWLASARRLAGARAADAVVSHAAGRCVRGPVLARVRRAARTTAGLQRGWLCVYRVRFTRADGRLIEQTITPIHADAPGSTRVDRSTLATRLEAARPALDAHAWREARARRAVLGARLERADALVALRRAAIAARDRTDIGLQQLPLFAELASEAGRARDPLVAEDAEPHHTGTQAGERDSALSVDCHLAAVVVVS